MIDNWSLVLYNRVGASSPSILGVLVLRYFWVELNTVVFLIFVCHCCVWAKCLSLRFCEISRFQRYFVTVAHPNVLSCLKGQRKVQIHPSLVQPRSRTRAQWTLLLYRQVAQPSFACRSELPGTGTPESNTYWGACGGILFRYTFRNF